ncbi:hypothetical protein RRG08_028968 [Elysia crispata]|uniref:Uncharacterized protein n=1 Tax=Elysia crispata TaxID=231223 RepID=A0AAE1E364_9GAST|nr:hypothetical protein RRG08_028968 [Elysia crispata]
MHQLIWPPRDRDGLRYTNFFKCLVDLQQSHGFKPMDYADGADEVQQYADGADEVQEYADGADEVQEYADNEDEKHIYDALAHNRL